MIHALAHVENSILGEGTKVWQFASVIRGSWIGLNCNIASCAIVDGAVLGDECLIGHGSSVHPGTKIGDRVFVGPCVTFCNDMWPRVSKEGFDLNSLLSGKWTSIRVGDDVSIGAGCVILPGVIIGEGSVIAAGSRVDRSVPEFSLQKPSGEVVKLAPRIPDRMREAV